MRDGGRPRRPRARHRAGARPSRGCGGGGDLRRRHLERWRHRPRHGGCRQQQREDARLGWHPPGFRGIRGDGSAVPRAQRRPRPCPGRVPPRRGQGLCELHRRGDRHRCGRRLRRRRAHHARRAHGGRPHRARPLRRGGRHALRLRCDGASGMHRLGNRHHRVLHQVRWRRDLRARWRDGAHGRRRDQPSRARAGRRERHRRAAARRLCPGFGRRRGLQHARSRLRHPLGFGHQLRPLLA